MGDFLSFLSSDPSAGGLGNLGDIFGTGTISTDLGSLTGGAGYGGLPNLYGGGITDPFQLGGGGSTDVLGSLGNWFGQNSNAIGNLISGGANLVQGNQLMNLAGMADPFGPYRGGFGAQLAQLMQNPSMVTQLPGYQAGMGAAEQALTRNLAGMGLAGGASGTAADALARFGAQYQGTAFNNYFNQLAGLSGANINGAPAALEAITAGMGLRNQGINTVNQGGGQGGGGGLGGLIGNVVGAVGSIGNAVDSIGSLFGF